MSEAKIELIEFSVYKGPEVDIMSEVKINAFNIKTGYWKAELPLDLQKALAMSQTPLRTSRRPGGAAGQTLWFTWDARFPA